MNLALCVTELAAARVRELVVAIVTVSSTLTDRVIVSGLQIASRKSRFTLAAIEAGLANRARSLIETGRDLWV